jgi:hypothetical protein
MSSTPPVRILFRQGFKRYNTISGRKNTDKLPQLGPFLLAMKKKKEIQFLPQRLESDILKGKSGTKERMA